VPELDAAADRAADELRGWLEAGERVVALLASPGPHRRRALDALVDSLHGRFVAARWTQEGNTEQRREASALESLRGSRVAPTLLIAEDGEELGAEGARVLRALAHDPAGAHRVVVAVAAEEAGAVLAGLGPALEVVVLREPRSRGAAVLRAPVAVAALALAAGSLAIAATLLLPRLQSGDATPASASAPAPVETAGLPPVSGAPPPGAGAQAPAPAPAAPPAARSAPASSPAPAPSPARAQRTEPAQREPRAVAPAPPPPSAPPAREIAREEPAGAPGSGWLVVNAIPRAAIVVDGSAVGETPIVRHPVGGGRHKVTARFADGRHDDRVIDVRGGELYLMFDGRQPEAGTAPSSGGSAAP